MAGMGDYVFRTVCIEHGADFVTTEMISAKAVCYNDEKTFRLARITEKELPAAVQIFGSEPECMAKAVTVLLDRYSKSGAMPVHIDINMGCPVPKVVKNGEGSALMKNPSLAGKIVKACVASAGEIPVTVKMRLGWDKNSINAVEFARVLEQS